MVSCGVRVLVDALLGKIPFSRMYANSPMKTSVSIVSLTI